MIVFLVNTTSDNIKFDATIILTSAATIKFVAQTIWYLVLLTSSRKRNCIFLLLSYN